MRQLPYYNGQSVDALDTMVKNNGLLTDEQATEFVNKVMRNFYSTRRVWLRCYSKARSFVHVIEKDRAAELACLEVFPECWFVGDVHLWAISIVSAMDRGPSPWIYKPPTRFPDYSGTTQTNWYERLRCLRLYLDIKGVPWVDH